MNESMRMERRPRERAKQAWRVVAAGLVLGVIGSLTGGGRPAGAAPVQQGPACQWHKAAPPPDPLPAPFETWENCGIVGTFQGDERMQGLGGIEFYCSGQGRRVLRGASVHDLSSKPEGEYRFLEWNSAVPYLTEATRGAGFGGFSARRIAPDTYEAVAVSTGMNGDRSYTHFKRTDIQLHATTFHLTICDDIVPEPRYVFDQAYDYDPFENSIFAYNFTNASSRLGRVVLDRPEPTWETAQLWQSARGGGADVVLRYIGAQSIVLGQQWLRRLDRSRLITQSFLDVSGGWRSATWQDFRADGIPPSSASDYVYGPYVASWKAVIVGSWGRGADASIKVLDLSTRPFKFKDLSIGASPFDQDQDWQVGYVGVFNGEDVFSFGAWIPVVPGPGGSRYETYYVRCTLPAGPVAPLATRHGTLQTSSPLSHAERSAISGIDLIITASLSRSAAFPLLTGALASSRVSAITPCIRNLGTAPAPRFTVRADDGVTWTAPGLGARQALCLEAKASRGRSVTVDPEGRVREGDEGNNTRVVEPGR